MAGEKVVSAQPGNKAGLSSQIGAFAGACATVYRESLARHV